MLKFFVCDHCGKMVTFVKEHSCPTKCCGEPMRELVPNTTEAATEKHIPVVTVEGSAVKVVVGSVEHPMTEEHLIEWVCIETTKGSQIKYLKAGEKPVAEFALAGEELVKVYAYCNLHGLWANK